MRKSPWVALLALLAGCAQVGNVAHNSIDQAEPLGLVLTPPDPNPINIAHLASYTRADRDGYALLWMKKSDDLCSPYKATIIRVSRDSRLTTDLTATILGILATTFTPVNTVRALAAGAAIATGTGAVFESDTFNGQVGDIVTAAIQTARQNQANQIIKNLKQYDVAGYSLYQALLDVSDYHDMCSLNTALIQIRKSLQATSPDAGFSPPAAHGTQTSGGVSAKILADLESNGPPITDPGKPLQPLTPPAPAPHRLNQTEQSLAIATITSYQTALCALPIDGDLGALGSVTRTNIGEYLGIPPSTPVRLTPTDLNDLERAVREVGSCSAKGFKNGFEVARYGLSGNANEVPKLQKKLAAKLANLNVAVPTSGMFDPKTREAIQLVRQKSGVALTLGDQMDNQLDIFLNSNPDPFPSS